jgi:hypothetical protein
MWGSKLQFKTLDLLDCLVKISRVSTDLTHIISNLLPSLPLEPEVLRSLHDG